MKQVGAYAFRAFVVVLVLLLAGCAGMGESASSTDAEDASVGDAGDASEGGTAAPSTGTTGDDGRGRSSAEEAESEAPAEAPAEAPVEAPVEAEADSGPRPEPSSAAAPKSSGAEASARGSASGEREAPSFVTSDAPAESGLSAGLADDNRQYGYFLDFLQEYEWARHYPLDVSERIVISVRDGDGESVPNATVEVSAGGSVIDKGRTLADGTYQLNPSLHGPELRRYSARIEDRIGTRVVEIEREGRRRIEVSFDGGRALPQSIPLDIVFVLDTTGSMGEEIARLKRTIELIHLNLTTLSVPTTVRFGLVLYKDIGDEYRTRRVALTGDLKEFRRELDAVTASGGGDTPEDLQAALEETVEAMSWNDRGIRLAFVITDAPPHLDYGQGYDYTVAAREARKRALKIFSVGTGGLDIHGEYVLRQIAQFTGGAYIFLTYGERGESEGGAPGSVSHHTGANYRTDKLEAIIIRLAKEELSLLTDAPIEQPEPYFTARKLDTEERERTLSTLFSQVIEQLADFSTIAVSPDVPVAVLPIVGQDDASAADAEYFTEQLVLSAAMSDRIALVDRRNLQEILDEQKIQLSGLTDSETVVKVGRLMNARMLIVGSLYRPDEYELFLRLLRVETGEVLSVTKARLETALGIPGGER